MCVRACVLCMCVHVCVCVCACVCVVCVYVLSVCACVCVYERGEKRKEKVNKEDKHYEDYFSCFMFTETKLTLKIESDTVNN